MAATRRSGPKPGGLRQRETARLRHLAGELNESAGGNNPDWQ